MRLKDSWDLADKTQHIPDASNMPLQTLYYQNGMDSACSTLSTFRCSCTISKTNSLNPENLLRPKHTSSSDFQWQTTVASNMHTLPAYTYPRMHLSPKCDIRCVVSIPRGGGNLVPACCKPGKPPERHFGPPVLIFQYCMVWKLNPGSWGNMSSGAWLTWLRTHPSQGRKHKQTPLPPLSNTGWWYLPLVVLLCADSRQLWRALEITASSFSYLSIITKTDHCRCVVQCMQLKLIPNSWQGLVTPFRKAPSFHFFRALTFSGLWDTLSVTGEWFLFWYQFMSQVGTGYLGSYTAILEPTILPYNSSLDFKQGTHWTLMWGALGMVMSQLKPLSLLCCCQSSTGTSCHLHIKAGTFLCLHNLQKTHSKCTNIVQLWQWQGFSLENDTKFGLIRMLGGGIQID